MTLRRTLLWLRGCSEQAGGVTGRATERDRVLGFLVEPKPQHR